MTETKRILIVEDEKAIRKLYSDELNEEGYDIFAQESGYHLVDNINKFKPHLILLDIKLRDHNGIDLFYQIRKHFKKHIPIVFCTAYDYDSTLAAKEADGYVLKSSDLSGLKNEIKRILYRRIEYNNESKTTYTQTEDVFPSSTLVINPLHFGLKIKFQLSDLKNKTQCLIIDLKSLLENHSSDEFFSLIEKSLSAAMYSNILIRHYTTILKNIHLDIMVFRLKKSIEHVVNSLIDEIRENDLSIEYKIDDYISTDRDLLEQVIFVILKNINDYLYQNTGFLKITVLKLERETKKNENLHIIEFKYGIKTTSYNKKDSKNRLLFVDDELNFLTLVDETFSDEGYEVCLASDGYECLDVLRDEDFDLIVLDINMLGMKGVEVLETLRRNKKNINIPVVIYTAAAELLTTDFVNQVSRFAPVAVEEKSSDLSQLIEVIDNLLHQDFAPFSLENLLSLNLENSIKRDNILKMGFFGIKKIIKLLKGNIFFETMDSGKTHLIRLEILNLTPSLKETDLEYSYLFNEDPITYFHLKELNEHIRHDLKNKLLPIKNDIRNIKKSYKNKHEIITGETRLYESINNQIDRCVTLLNEIGKIL